MKKQKTERLDKILALSGFGSRKDVKKLIKSGQVSVNGQVVGDAGAQVNPLADKITVLGNILNYHENVYIMMNKPEGVISSTRDNVDITVIDILEGEYSHRKLFPVGRLDKDAEGLILLTDDGKMAHRLLSPKNKVEKVYYVEVKGKLDKSDIEAFASGIDLEDFITLPAKLEILKAADISQAKVTICEGKFHQIKRMMKSRGKDVIYLKRLSIGPLVLDQELDPGEWRELSKEEIDSL
ncbi:MAG: pseudouridine synthase [Tepidanaerobacteraceae bacterium]|jgi:16S rRNA pseudouridine516 synthase|nr:rRNA pseudouridine synthase [Thermoanaerobacterales bacterium]